MITTFAVFLLILAITMFAVTIMVYDEPLPESIILGVGISASIVLYCVLLTSCIRIQEYPIQHPIQETK